jgi:hypothetical protein
MWYEGERVSREEQVVVCNYIIFILHPIPYNNYIIVLFQELFSFKTPILYENNKNKVNYFLNNNH